MFRAIGFVLIVWFLSTQFSSSFQAFDRATTATFGAVESAAIQTQENFK